MLLLVPTEDSAESASPNQQRVLVILPPRANLGADTMVVPRERRAGGMATGHYPLFDPLTPTSGRRRHSTQFISISSSLSPLSSSPFVPMSHSVKKERRGSHLGVSRSAPRHSLSHPSSRIFTTYSMSSSSPSFPTIPSAQRCSSMMVDDDSEDDNLHHEAFKSSRADQSPLLFSGNSQHEEDLRLLTSCLKASATTGDRTMTRSTGKKISPLKKDISVRSTVIPQGMVPPTPTATAIDTRLSKEVESAEEDNEGIEREGELQSAIHDVSSTEIVQAPLLLSVADNSSSTVSSSSLSSSPSSSLQASLMVSSMSSPGLRSPLEDSVLTSPSRGRRHVSEDRTAYLTADDISSSLNAHLTPLEIQNRLYHQRERQAWSRSQRRARSTSHRPHHHRHPHHRQHRESTTGTSHSLGSSSSQQRQWPMSNQISLQHQLLSLALATPSRIGAVHPFDRDPATMPPPPPHLLSHARPISTLSGAPTAGDSLTVPIEEKQRPLQNITLIDHHHSGGSLSHLPKLPPSAFRTVESLRQDEEKIRKEQLEQQQRARLQQEQEEIDRFLVFPSPTL